MKERGGSWRGTPSDLGSEKDVTYEGRKFMIQDKQHMNFREERKKIKNKQE